jgi:hypothetical protein
MALPDFLLAGAPKAGTTALHVALARHPQLYLSRTKEPKFFLADGRPPQLAKGPGDARTTRELVWRREDYEALFDPAPPGALLGESTSLYLYDAAAQARIQALIPGVRVIAVLRDPIDRAHSNWAHLWSAGLEPEADFVAACGLEDRREAAGWAPFWRYLKLGRYGEQLESLWSHLPREHTLVLRYQELRESPVATLDRICAFLGVQTGVLTEVPAENVTTHASSSPGNRLVAQALRLGTAIEHGLPRLPVGSPLRPLNRALERHLQREQRPRQPLTPDQRDVLIPRVANDVRRLEALTGESFAHWLDAHRDSTRSALAPQGRIGTAHNSIDRPIRE